MFVCECTGECNCKLPDADYIELRLKYLHGEWIRMGDEYFRSVECKDSLDGWETIEIYNKIRVVREIKP